MKGMTDEKENEENTLGRKEERGNRERRWRGEMMIVVLWLSEVQIQREMREATSSRWEMADMMRTSWLIVLTPRPLGLMAAKWQIKTTEV